MATRYDTQHNEGNSTTHCVLKKRRVIQDVSNENVKYGIAAANLSRVPKCPNQCLSNVTIINDHGNVVGHVSSYVDKLRSVKPTDHCRLGCRDVMSSATSSVIPQTINSQGTNLSCCCSTARLKTPSIVLNLTSCVMSHAHTNLAISTLESLQTSQEDAFLALKSKRQKNMICQAMESLQTLLVVQKGVTRILAKYSPPLSSVSGEPLTLIDRMTGRLRSQG